MKSRRRWNSLSGSGRVKILDRAAVFHAALSRREPEAISLLCELSRARRQAPLQPLKVDPVLVAQEKAAAELRRVREFARRCEATRAMP